MSPKQADWQMPTGVSQGVWDYTQADHIATDYDDFFSGHQLLLLDLQIARQFIGLNRTVIDLGCATGRALVPLLADGRHGIGVDLSESMLNVLRGKIAKDRLSIDCIKANLVDLSCLADESVDDAICLFSTLGMIEGSCCRQQFLRHVYRLLRPGGCLVIHAHNLWFNLWDPHGPKWLVKNLILSRGSVNRGRGDRLYDYRGIRNFLLHSFTRSELIRLLTSSGFCLEHWTAVGSAGDGGLRYSRCLPALRARGWLVVARRATD